MAYAAFLSFYAVNRPWQHPYKDPSIQTFKVTHCTMFERSDGSLGFVGGLVDDGETVEQCMLREFFEETGIRAERFFNHGLNYITYSDVDHKGRTTIHKFVELTPFMFQQLVGQVNLWHSAEGALTVKQFTTYPNNQGLPRIIRGELAKHVADVIPRFVADVAAVPPRPIVALDGDMVLLHFNDSVATFLDGRLKNDGSHYNIIKQMDNQFDCTHAYNITKDDVAWVKTQPEFWSQCHPIPKADELVSRLFLAGVDVVVVTTMNPAMWRERLNNLWDNGIYVNDVIATKNFRDPNVPNPKLAIIKQLNPICFVDDLTENLIDLPPNITKIWLDHGYKDRQMTPPDDAEVVTNMSDLIDLTLRLIQE